MTSENGTKSGHLTDEAVSLLRPVTPLKYTKQYPKVYPRTKNLQIQLLDEH
jgi:hypothetical protein